MANEIGSYTFSTMNGSPAPIAEAVEALPRAVGEDGTRWRLTGALADDTRISTLAIVATAAAARAARDLFSQLQGRSEDIVDAFDETFTNCMIVKVRSTIRPIHQAGADRYAVLSEFIVRQGPPA